MDFWNLPCKQAQDNYSSVMATGVKLKIEEEISPPPPLSY